MSYYDTTPAPPQTHEIIPAITTLLKAGATLTTALGGASKIYDRRFPHDLDGKGWKRLLVREPLRPPTREAIHSYRKFLFDVLLEVHEDVPNPDQFLQAAHNEVHSLLNGQTLSPTKAAVALPIERRTLPSATAYDRQAHSYYSVALYTITLKPVGG